MHEYYVGTAAQPTFMLSDRYWRGNAGRSSGRSLVARGLAYITQRAANAVRAPPQNMCIDFRLSRDAGKRYWQPSDFGALEYCLAGASGIQTPE